LAIARNKLRDVSRVGDIIYINRDRYPGLSIQNPYIEIGWLLYLPPKEIMQIVSLDYKNLVSELLFFRAIVYFGDKVETKVMPNWHWIYKAMETSTYLDPYNIDSYYFTEAVLAWDAKAPKEANIILERGAKFRNWDWYIPFFMGFNSFYFLKDNKEAAKWFSEAAKINKEVAPIAAKFYYKVNETALAIAFLKKMYEAGFRILSFGIESAKDKTLKEINKGFDISSVRKAFQIIAKYNFYIHSYFIVGNIGENEEDMLKISGFAKEIGIDTLGLSILRTEKYSPLNDVIKDTDGYYIGADNGVYSQKYGKKELKRIRKRIYKRFYTPLQCLKIARKTYSIGLFRLNSGIKGMLVYLFRSLMRRNS